MRVRQPRSQPKVPVHRCGDVVAIVISIVATNLTVVTISRLVVMLSTKALFISPRKVRNHDPDLSRPLGNNPH